MDTRTVDVGRVELAVAEAGVGGRPLLLLHGFTGAKEDFTDWLDPLADRGWHAVAPDHRGHGASGRPDGEEHYSFDVMAQDALDLVDTLGWSRFVLLGHSMGGMVAQHVALVAPGRVAGLVLMDTGHGPVEGIDPDDAELAMAIVRDSGIEGLADVLAERESPLTTPANQRLLDERPGYREFGDRKFRASAAAMYAAMVGHMIGCDDRLDRLASLTVATLVVVGQQDLPFLAASERMAKVMPGARLVVLPDAGHSPQFESPDRWWEALTTFLDDFDELDDLDRVPA